MRVRNVQRHGEEEIELQMTPMIDIVFQLLIFFIMTFKIVTPEGDFNVKMPRGAPSPDNIPDPGALMVRVTLTARQDGVLAGVVWAGDEKPLSKNDPFGELRRKILEHVEDDVGPGSIAEATEVEFDCDPKLKFKYVMNAITAVAGYHDPKTREIIKVIEKIKFTPKFAPKKPGSS